MSHLPNRLRIGHYELDMRRRELLRGTGEPIELRQQALDVLMVLAEQVGNLVSKAELMQRVWPDVIVTEDSLVQAIGDVRRALGDTEHRLVRTVTRRGYMLVLPPADEAASIPIPDAAGACPPAASLLPVSAAPSRRFGRWWTWGGLSIGLLALAAWNEFGRAPPAPQEEAQIAVLAFRDRTGSEDAEMFGRGFAEDVILQLGRNHGLGVVAPHSSFAVSGQNLGATELGLRLAAQYLVDGVLQRIGDKLVVEVVLIDTRAEKVLWVSKHTSEGGAVVESRDEIVERVAGTVLSKLRERERRRAASVPPKSLDVYALTLKGTALKHRFHPDGMREGRAVLERALAIDPKYAPAWAVLGWLNAIDGHLDLTGEWSPLRAEEAIAQVQHSIELDPADPRAYIALADAYSLAGRTADAATASRRAVELAPGDAEAWLLHAFHLLPTHPPGEALAAINRAFRLYPIAPVYFDAMHSFVLWANGDAVAALRTAESCTQRAPRWRDCIVVQALVHAEAGEVEEARKLIRAQGLQLAGLTSAAVCGRYSGSAANVERCHRLVQAAGIPH